MSNVNALKRSSPDCAILTTLCSQPFADSLNQKCPRIHIPDWLIKEKPHGQNRVALQGPQTCKRSTKTVGKINADISAVYTSKKIKDEMKVREDKPPLVSQQCVVYSFQCGLCDAGYVGYTCRHIHQRRTHRIGNRKSPHRAARHVARRHHTEILNL